MTVNDVLTLLIEVLFVLLGIVTILDYLRHRDVTRRDIALVFGSLALAIGLPALVRVLPAGFSGLSKVSTVALIAQPYLMLRLLRYFRPAPARVRNAALISMVVCIGVALLYPAPVPLLVTLPIVAYFVMVDGYAMILLVRGALSSAGVVRQRLRLAATGSGLLALTLLLVVVIALFHSIAAIATIFALMAALLSAVAYYLGFAPPRWLLRTWQLAELRNFLLDMSVQTAGHVEDNLNRLCRAANQAVGGMAAGVVQWNEFTHTWQHSGDTDEALVSKALASGDRLIEQVWQKRRPAYFYVSENADAGDRLDVQSIDADTWLAVPMIVGERLWGLLLVFLRHRSLFIDDDLSLLELFAQQCAVVLENDRLVEELRGYSEVLEQKVADRTTALQRSEEAVRQLNAELEERVRDRTAQLETANKELEAFSYSVSHDLRAPLRSIDGFSRILIEDYARDLSPEAQRYLVIVREDTQRMGELIDDLLTFSRLSRQDLNKQPVNPANIVNVVLNDLRAAEPERKIDIKMEDLPTCQADPALLKQVYVNLLSNALKYSRKRECSVIEIGCRNENGEAVYYVKDNGVGFNMRYAHKLFKVFQRLHSTEEYEGTGVGLAIIQRVINRHGGRVWAESEVDHGATFYFTLEGAAAHG